MMTMRYATLLIGALFVGILAIPTSVRAENPVICPPETGVKASKSVNANNIVYINNIVDYITGQICTGLSGAPGAANGGITSSLQCKGLETVPARTQAFLRNRDCPNFETN